MIFARTNNFSGKQLLSYLVKDDDGDYLIRHVTYFNTDIFVLETHYGSEEVARKEIFELGNEIRAKEIYDRMLNFYIEERR